MYSCEQLDRNSLNTHGEEKFSNTSCSEKERQFRFKAKNSRAFLLITIACAWIDLPGLRYGRLFIGRPCEKRADDLLKLGRHQLKMAIAIYTGHAPVRGPPVYYGPI